MCDDTEMDFTRRNHYVPRSYLGGFCGRDGFLWLYSKDGSPPRKQAPANTAAESNLYTTQNEDGTKSDALERHLFAPLDGDMKAILVNWVNKDYQIQDSEIAKMAVYMAYQHARVPRNIGVMGEILVAAHIKMTKEVLNDPEGFHRIFVEAAANYDGDFGSEEEMREAIKNQERDFKIEADKTTAMAFSIERAEGCLRFLTAMKWSIVHAPEHYQFITSDCPVVVFMPDGSGKATFGAGFGMSQTEVTFHISPSACIWLRYGQDERRWTCGRDVASELNRRTAYSAERYVFTDRQSEQTQELVAGFTSTYGQPKLDRQELDKLLDEA
jgi:hypothetical protein